MWDTQQVQCLSGTPRVPLPKLHCGLLRLYTSLLLRRFLMVSRSMALSQQAENLPGKFNSIVPPLIELGGMGRKDKELEAILLAGLPRIFRRTHPLHPPEYLSQERGFSFRSSSKNSPANPAVALVQRKRIPRAPSSLRTFLFFPRKGYTSLSFRTRFSKLWSPLGFADSFGSFGTILKTFQVSGIELLATVRRCSG